MITRKSKHEYRINFGKIVSKPYTPEDLRQALKWCAEVFGPSGRNKKYRWRFGWADREADYLYFRTEKDALFFVLRWS